MASRVFLGLTDVAGYFRSLEYGLRDLGTDARLHDFSPNVLGYGGGDRALAGRGRLLAFGAAPAGSWRRRIWGLAGWAYRRVRAVRGLLLLPLLLARYDSFVLSGSGLFLDGRELPLLRLFRKRVVVVFTGSDHRPPYLNGIWVRDARTNGYSAIARDARRLQARVRRVERWSTAVVALPESAQFHTRPFVDFLRVGFPFDPAATDGDLTAPPPSWAGSPGIHALHSPTQPASKGSAEVRQAIEHVRAAGADLVLHEMTGRPHAEVIAAIKACDLVINEVWSDTPMAGLSTEASYFGKPVVVTGYAAAAGGFRGLWRLPPSVYEVPERLEGVVAELARNADLRRERGEEAQRFIRSEWAPAEVARRMLALLDGHAPADWIVRPDDVPYLDGWGMPRELRDEGLRGLVAAHGPAALALDHRPRVRDRLLAKISVASSAERPTPR